MDSGELKSLQAPLKARYRKAPKDAVITLKAEGSIGEGVTCSVATAKAMVEAGLHPATGGSGFHACSGDMLLQALVACAGVTLNAVSTALEIPLSGATVRAEGDLDFRGTLGVDRVLGLRAVEAADLRPLPPPAGACLGTRAVAGLVLLDGALTPLVDLPTLIRERRQAAAPDPR